ncbi:hypothetical protein ES703_21007 [subsurface metagenome]
MLAVQVTVDERSFKEAAHILRAVPRAVPRVFRRAIGRTVDMAATDLKRRVGSQITAKKGEIAKGIGKKKTTYFGSIGARPFRPGLLAFPGTRQTKRGVSYRISRTVGRKTIEHGFIATMPSGHRGVFARGDLSRLPIGEKRGPSIWKIITGTAGLLKAAVDAAGKRMGKLINDQIGVEFRRWRNR